MTDHVEAIYENGQLRLLTPVKLTNGQRVQVAIESLPSDEALRNALGDLVSHWPDPSDNQDAELENLADEIDHALQGSKPLSEIIIEDRGKV
jgi:predicted DNA-binding antitoxin AbrB/MazE fold protein